MSLFVWSLHACQATVTGVGIEVTAHVHPSPCDILDCRMCDGALYTTGWSIKSKNTPDFAEYQQIVLTAFTVQGDVCPTDLTVGAEDVSDTGPVRCHLDHFVVAKEDHRT